MKREGQSVLSKMLQPGEQITIVHASDRIAWDATVKRVKGSAIVCRFVEEQMRETWHVEPDGTHRTQTDVVRVNRQYTVKRRDEGRTWARGWDTQAAYALKAVVAIRKLDDNSLGFSLAR